MATIKFLIQSKSNPANIYLRLSLNRSNVFKRKTPYVVNPLDWSQKTGYPKQTDTDLKILKTDLSSLSNAIERNLNRDTSKGIEINGNWLQRVHMPG